MALGIENPMLMKVKLEVCGLRVIKDIGPNGPKGYNGDVGKTGEQRPKGGNGDMILNLSNH